MYLITVKPVQYSLIQAFKALHKQRREEYICIDIDNDNDADIITGLDEAWAHFNNGCPVILDVNIDYSKQTRFTKGIVATNLKCLSINTKIRRISRALVRKVTR
jgi:hypothetical protein